MNQTFNVTKASGITEEFSVDKLKNSLAKAGAGADAIQHILDILLPTLHQGVSTKKIYKEAYRILRKQSKHQAAKYYLKKGILDLGPSGFPFEQYIGKLFDHEGYQVEVGIILNGKCVTHEVDVVAKKENQIMLMECKFKNQAGIAVDVKTPLYIHSRFQDILDAGFVANTKSIFTGWIVTNSKFTVDATAYANCKQMKLLGWNYPQEHSLKDRIDKSGLYPLTCITSLTHAEKQWLLENDIVLAKDVYNNEKLLRKAGVKELRFASIFEEGKRLCKL